MYQAIQLFNKYPEILKILNTSTKTIKYNMEQKKTIKNKTK